MPDTDPPAPEPAHDVLAAEAFAVPAPDPALRNEPVVLPEDPSGISEPHDVLAAEEFAMPAGRQSRAGSALAEHVQSSWRRAAVGALLGFVAQRFVRRR